MRGEGLRRYDEQRSLRVKRREQCRHRMAIHVGQKMQPQIASCIRPQRCARHGRTEIGTANADVHHVRDATACASGPGAAANPLGKRFHACQYLLDLTHQLFALPFEAGSGWHAQHGMQDGAPLGQVDRLAAEHRVPQWLDTLRACEICEQHERLGLYQILRMIEQDAGRFQREPGGALRGRPEELGQPPLACEPGVDLQRGVGGHVGEGRSSRLGSRAHGSVSGTGEGRSYRGRVLGGSWCQRPDDSVSRAPTLMFSQRACAGRAARLAFNSAHRPVVRVRRRRFTLFDVPTMRDEPGPVLLPRGIPVGCVKKRHFHHRTPEITVVKKTNIR